MDPKAKIAAEIDQTIVNLQRLNISASYDNMITLVACLKTLADVRQEITILELKEEIQNGNPGQSGNSSESGNG